ncbi:DUF3149 domain-containing protein [Aeromonas australiensis]|uniref:DUF3149 domain-containing protein n=1 Tax=Aeromonas australiensis TaxID=1114880 RepID=UPI001F1B25B1|nr:DUF3149 domain-containing protein [Aeromonas australiensis]
MDFWLDLMFGNSVGLMSMLVIIGTFLLISSYAVYFIYKVLHAQPPHAEQPPSQQPHSQQPKEGQ